VDRRAFRDLKVIPEFRVDPDSEAETEIQVQLELQEESPEDSRAKPEKPDIREIQAWTVFLAFLVTTDFLD